MNVNYVYKDSTIFIAAQGSAALPRTGDHVKFPNSEFEETFLVTRVLHLIDGSYTQIAITLEKEPDLW